jgi:hypothetical protein
MEGAFWCGGFRITYDQNEGAFLSASNRATNSVESRVKGTLKILTPRNSLV